MRQPLVYLHLYRAPCIRCVGGWVYPRAGLNAVARSLFWESNPGNHYNVGDISDLHGEEYEFCCLLRCSNLYFGRN
jgi:hypothetical protein